MVAEISEKSWNGYFTNYFFGEKAGADLIWKLQAFAPGTAERAWVEIWAAEEDHHHELWSALTKKKNIKIAKLPSTFEALYAKTGDFVSEQNWVGAMTGAAIIEHISSAAAEYLKPLADTDTQAVFEKILADDVRHIAFDVKQMEIASKTADGKKALWSAHKAFLPVILNWPLHEPLLDGEMDIINNAYQTHRAKVKPMGIDLAEIHFSNSAAYRVKKKALELLAEYA